MRYGLDKHRGFWVVDDERRLASYSYPGSINADFAAKRIEQIANFIFQKLPEDSRGLPDRIVEEHYQRGVEALKAIES